MAVTRRTYYNRKGQLSGSSRTEYTSAAERREQQRNGQLVGKGLMLLLGAMGLFFILGFAVLLTIDIVAASENFRSFSFPTSFVMFNLYVLVRLPAHYATGLWHTVVQGHLSRFDNLNLLIFAVCVAAPLALLITVVRRIRSNGEYRRRLGYSVTALLLSPTIIALLAWLAQGLWWCAKWPFAA